MLGMTGSGKKSINSPNANQISCTGSSDSQLLHALNFTFKPQASFDINSSSIHCRKEASGLFEGWFWKYSNIRGAKVRCLAFQGHATKLAGVLHKLSRESQHTIMVDRAEIMLHDDYGSANYWKVNLPHLLDESNKQARILPLLYPCKYLRIISAGPSGHYSTLTVLKQEFLGYYQEKKGFSHETLLRFVGFSWIGCYRILKPHFLHFSYIPSTGIFNTGDFSGILWLLPNIDHPKSSVRSIEWQVRRSMRFSDRLYALANEFREDHLQSNDEVDSTVLPADWRDEEPSKLAKGGDYLCGHLRRQDFLIGRLVLVFNLFLCHHLPFFLTRRRRYCRKIRLQPTRTHLLSIRIAHRIYGSPIGEASLRYFRLRCCGVVLMARSDEVPSLRLAAKQLLQVAKAINVSTVFIASDGTDQGGSPFLFFWFWIIIILRREEEILWDWSRIVSRVCLLLSVSVWMVEMKELEGYLKGDNGKDSRRMLLYRPPLSTRREIKDGGVAIVEQIICSRARHFIGSFESTFSFRIQEEREIMNFPAESTFNRFCGDATSECEQPAKWRILHWESRMACSTGRRAYSRSVGFRNRQMSTCNVKVAGFA